MSSYFIAIGTFVGIYALLALGLNIQWGFTGLVNLGHVGFFAIGA
jgi:branched-chain amino acid transport system permease protein